VFQLRALCALNRFEEAIEKEGAYRLLSHEPQGQVNLAMNEMKKALAGNGPRGYWRVHLEVEKQAGWGPFDLARDYAQMGETEQAIECLQEAVKKRDVWLTFYGMTDWTLDPVRSDPRFHHILRQMNLE
jgi:FimV-like protein